jgi:hypothetical protein
MEINVTRFMHDLGTTPHNQVNLGSEASTLSWNEALEATSKLEPLSVEEYSAFFDYLAAGGMEAIPDDPFEVSAMLRQELRCLILEGANEEGGYGSLFKADDNQWYLQTN